MSNKPNIVFIHNDHQAYYRWWWNQENRPLTPNFDKLAEGGAKFTNAYCASPLCGPTRRTVLTGLFPHTHKQYHNYTDPPYDHEVYLQTLTDNGYDNFYYGKWHAGPGAANEHGCKGFSYTDYSNPYTKPEYKEYLAKRNLPEAVHKISDAFYVSDICDRGDWDGLEPGADYKCKADWCGEHGVGVTTTPKETHESFFLANLACDQLEELAKENTGKPFSIRVDFWGPHQPHFPTQEYLDMYPDFHIEPYGSFADDLANKPKTYFRERNVPLSVDDIIIQPSPKPWSGWENLIRHAFAHQTMVDAAGGLIIDKLKELGLDKNTIIIWTTDHGDGLASHGGHFDKGSYMTEEVLRIPFAINWPGVIPAGQVRDEFISTVDFPVTILDSAGLSYTKNPVQGKSILPLVKGEDVQWRDDIFTETHGHGYGEDIMARVVRYQHYKLIKTKDDVEELYDLEKDHYELNNLANDPAYGDIKQELYTRLARWQAETADPYIF